MGVLPQRLLGVQEVDSDLVILERLDRARVEGRLAALGGGDGQVDLVVENMPGVGEFGLTRQQFGLERERERGDQEND